jgi:D-arginine dehydrogenase
VAIIGAGFAGLSTAWWLAQLKVDRVLLLDRSARIASHASGRGAGIGRQICDDDDTTALAVAGAAMLRQNSGQLAGCWTPCGGTLWFESELQRQRFGERADRFAVAFTQVGGKAQLGLHFPSDGLIDIAQLAVQYAQQAQSAGTQIAVDCNVLESKIHDAGIDLTTNLGQVTASVVVDAAGAWAGRVVKQQSFVAMQRHLLDVRISDENRSDYHWHLGAQGGVSQHYYRQHGSQRLCSPCDETIVDPDTLSRVDPNVERAAREQFSIAGDQLVATRVCLRTFSANRRMELGTDSEVSRLVWAAGLGGHGATSSPEVGRRVAAAVLRALESQ